MAAVIITNWWGIGFFCLTMFIVPAAGAIVHRAEKQDSLVDPHYDHPSTNPKETTHG